MDKKESPSVRMIDELGRVVIPYEARRVLDWGEKTPVEVWVDAQKNQIIIKQHVFCCMCCGKTEGLKSYKGRYFCSDCRDEISEL